METSTETVAFVPPDGLYCQSRLIGGGMYSESAIRLGAERLRRHLRCHSATKPNVNPSTSVAVCPRCALTRPALSTSNNLCEHVPHNYAHVVPYFAYFVDLARVKPLPL